MKIKRTVVDALAAEGPDGLVSLVLKEHKYRYEDIKESNSLSLYSMFNAPVTNYIIPLKQ